MAMHIKININSDYRNLPTTYMEQFCKALHPELELSPTCLNWFRQATEHCAALMQRTNIPGSQFWATVKNFIFPDPQIGLLNQKIPISIHPNRLSIHDCHALVLDIVNDYIFRAPRYSSESATNVLLWQILYSLLGVMALASVLVSSIFAYRKYVESFGVTEQKVSWFTLDNCISAQMRRNIRVVKYELRRLRVRHIVQPEELFAADGTKTLVMKMSTKLNFIDGIVTNNVQTTGRLYRMYDMYARNKKTEYKTETVTKALRFISNTSRKLRVLLIFDEDPVYDALMRRRSSSSPKRILAPDAKSIANVKAIHSSSSTPRSLSPIVKTKSSSPRTATTIPTYQPKSFIRRNSTFSLKTKNRDSYSDRFGDKETDKFRSDFTIKRKRL